MFGQTYQNLINNYMFYVYLLLDPTNYYLPFYIGKGKNDRWKNHLNETKENTDNKRKYYKIQKLLKEEYEIIHIKWQENMSEENAYNLETDLIKRFGREGIDKDGILTNICLDKRPPNPLGIVRSFKHCKSISNTKKGEKNPVAKFTNKEAINIFNDQRKVKEIVKDYPNSSMWLIYQIKNGKSYSDATGFSRGKISVKNYRNVVPDKLKKIIRNEKLNIKQLSKKYDINYHTIWGIINKK